MTTGLERISIVSQMLLGSSGLSVRLLEYLRTSIQQVAASAWPSDGAFDTALSLSSSAANNVQVDGTSLSTDGKGRILDINQAYPSRSVQFQNESAVVYYVGLRYASIPSGIDINPRNGRPQYRAWKDVIGIQDVPTSVSNLGAGQMRFFLDTVCEANVSHAGRKVVVWKKQLADGAINESIAYQEVTITFQGNLNYVDVSNALGQDFITASTTPTDYEVALLGPSVKRNTDLSTDPNTFFVGTVTGVGLGNTPVVFNTTGQRIHRPSYNASQVLISAYQWLTAGNVQAALQQIVDVLLSTSGSAKMGVNAAAFSVRDALTAGGLGNVADTSFTASSTVQDVLSALDLLSKRRKAFTATFADANTVADYARTALSNAFSTSGVYMLKHLADGATSPYEVPVAGASAGIHSYLIGERSDAGDSPEGKERLRTPVSGSTTATLLRGFLSRIYLDAGHAARFQVGGPAGSNLILEDWGARAGRLNIADMAAAYPQPFHLRNGRIRPQVSSEITLDGLTMTLGHVTGGEHFVHGLIENMVIEGPGTGGSPLACFQSNLSSSAAVPRPLTFRNCVFIQGAANVPCVLMSGGYRLVFENCLFLGQSGNTSLLVSASGSGDAMVHFRDCYFYAPEGSAIYSSGCSGVIDGCIFDTTGTTTAGDFGPQVVRAKGSGANGRSLSIRDCQVILGPGAVRETGSATAALVEIGDSTGTSGVVVDGLHIRYDSSAAAIHMAPTLVVLGSSDDSAVANNVTVDFNDKARASGVANTYHGTAAIVLCARSKVHNVELINMGNLSGDANGTHVMALLAGQASNITVDMGSGGDSSHRWTSGLFVQGGAEVRNIRMLGGTVSASSGMLFVGGTVVAGFSEGGNLVSGVLISSTTTGSGGNACVQVAGDYNVVSDLVVRIYSQFANHALLINGNNNAVSGGAVQSDGTSGFEPVRIASGTTGNSFIGFVIQYNATANAAMSLGTSAVIGGCVFRRTAGSTAVLPAAGSNVYGDNLTI